MEGLLEEELELWEVVMVVVVDGGGGGGGLVVEPCPMLLRMLSHLEVG